MLIQCYPEIGYGLFPPILQSPVVSVPPGPASLPEATLCSVAASPFFFSFEAFSILSLCFLILTFLGTPGDCFVERGLPDWFSSWLVSGYTSSA